MRLGLLLAAVVVVLDQLGKLWVVEGLMRPPGVENTPFHTPHAIEVAPFLDLVMAWNRGVSFGMFNNEGPYNALVLIVLALAIVAVLVVWMYRTRERLLVISLGLIIGGALGNVIDRIRFGAVADFIDVHIAGYHWPAFNLADSAITIGALLLLADALFGSGRSHKNRP